MPLSLMLDLLLAVLLVITICYAMSLNRKLGDLRRDKAELEKLAASFGSATVRAEEGVFRLKNTAEQLQQRIDKAQSLRDDLVFLIDRGGSAADRLEETVRSARNYGDLTPKTVTTAQPGVAQAQTGAPTAGPVPEPQADARTETERELLKALQAAR